MSGARERLAQFCASYEKVHRFQPSEDTILALDTGGANEAELTLSDLKAVLAQGGPPVLISHQTDHATREPPAPAHLHPDIQSYIDRVEALRAVANIMQATGKCAKGHLAVAVAAGFGTDAVSAEKAGIILNGLVETGHLVKDTMGADNWLPLFYPTKLGFDLLKAEERSDEA